jgi:hypothetical protein
MATLLVAAAVNIAVGLLINEFFVDDIETQGPRLDDLSVTDSAYGRPIFVHYGTVRTGGNIIWSSGLEEKANKNSVGKGFGGPSVSTTTFSYSTSLAVSFGEGVAVDILRIWADNKLIYDKTGTGATADATLNFRFYPGDEDQLPDPLIEAAEGVGNVPAHRGLCYIVIEDLPLADFANHIPNFQAEVAYATVASTPSTQLTTLAGHNIDASGGHVFIDPFSDFFYMMQGNSGGSSANALSSMSQLIVYPEQPILNIAAGFVVQQDGSLVAQSSPAGIVKRDPISFDEIYTLAGATAETEVGQKLLFNAAGGIQKKWMVGSRTGLSGNDGYTVWEEDVGGLSAVNHGRYTGANLSGMDNGPTMQDFFTGKLYFVAENSSTVNLHEFISHSDLGIAINDEVEERLVGSYSKTAVDGGGDFEGTGDVDGWCFIPAENAIIMSLGRPGNAVKIDLDDGTILATNDTGGFFGRNQWTRTSLFVRSNGTTYTTMRVSDLVDIDSQTNTDFGVNASPAGMWAYDSQSHSLVFASNATPDTGWRVFLDKADRAGTTLDLIVDDLSQRAGLPPADIDVTDLSTITVEGFSITRQLSYRQAIQPLQQAYLFDGVESDWIMEFKRRSTTSLLTLDEDFIGIIGESGANFVKEVRKQEVELPMRVNVGFSDVNTDYERSLHFDKRVQNPVPTQSAKAELTLNLPLVMDDPTAKQLAQKTLYTAWAERVSFSTELPWKYIKLDVTDVFTMPYQGDNRLLRMGKTVVGANLEQKIGAIQQDARSLDSDVPAGGREGFVPQIVASGLSTRMHLMNLPLLFASEDSGGTFSNAYWAASGYDTSWPGAQNFQSVNGDTYDVVGVANVEAAWGVVSGVIPDPEETNNGGTTTWDRNTVITIKPVRGSSQILSSTEAEVLEGANALAIIKADNSVEIIQFVTATVIDVSTIELTNLLRGRRGTEPEAFNHSGGESYVLLQTDGSALKFPLNIAQIDTALQYRGVTLNTSFEEAADLVFTYDATDLKPYAPTQIVGVPDPGTDKTWTWERRTRFNGELRDGTGDVPLNEESELYDVELYESDGTTLIVAFTDLTVKTLTITETDWTTTHGQSLVDGEIPPTIIDVYQKSAVVGRGKVLRVTA